MDMILLFKHSSTSVVQDRLSWTAFPAMLNLQSGEQSEVHSLWQCLSWSPKLSEVIHRTGPCLASQSVEGGAGLQDVVRGLRTCSAWTFIWMGNFQSVEVGVKSVQFTVWRLWLVLLCSASGCCPLPSQCPGVVATPSWSSFLGWYLLPLVVQDRLSWTWSYILNAVQR